MSEPETNPVGRPSAYKPEFGPQAEELCKLGAIDKDLAEFFEVDERTINRWKEAHPEFRQSIRAGKIIADMSPEEQRAIGFGPTPVDETADGPRTRPQRLATNTPALSDKQPNPLNSANGPVIWDPVLRAYVPAPSTADISGGLQSPSGVQGKDPLGSTTANKTTATNKEAQLNVMESALTQYEDLLRKNPAIVGAPGAIRGAAQNAVSAAGEFATAFGDVAPDAKLAEGAVKELAAKIGATSRDPAIAQARIMQADLAYKWAQMQNPSGEVSRQAFERALDAMSGGALANNQSALEAIGAVREGTIAAPPSKGPAPSV